MAVRIPWRQKCLGKLTSILEDRRLAISALGLPELIRLEWQQPKVCDCHPENMADPTRNRCFAPAAERNQAPICSVLQSILPAAGTVLEIASGTGQHAAFLAPRLQPRHWLPSDRTSAAHASICSWKSEVSSGTLYDPLDLDVTRADWPQKVVAWASEVDPIPPPITAIVNINMIHIAPWVACQGLMLGAAALLDRGGVLYLYGPFVEEGKQTVASNRAFDQSLRSQNPDWGLRNLSDVAQLAAEYQLQLSQVIAMPANNLSVVFIRQ